MNREKEILEAITEMENDGGDCPAHMVLDMNKLAKYLAEREEEWFKDALGRDILLSDHGIMSPEAKVSKLRGEGLNTALRAHFAAKQPKKWSAEDIKYGDDYWYFDIGYGKYTTHPSTWVGLTYDLNKREAGNCFPTKEAAQTALNEVIDLLKKKNL